MKVFGFFLAILVLVLVSKPSSAEIYRWVDEKGVVHYSDSPTQSESEASLKEEVPSSDPNPDEEVSAPGLNSEENSPPVTETQRSRLDPDFFKPLDASAQDPVSVDAPTVEIYETSWCGYCRKAKKFFRSRGIEFKAYDIEKDNAAARRMMALTRRRAVPFVVINGHPIQGYSEQEYEQALRK
jgi:glutaredoxin-like YruB-family protein